VAGRVRVGEMRGFWGHDSRALSRALPHAALSRSPMKPHPSVTLVQPHESSSLCLRMVTVPSADAHPSTSPYLWRIGEHRTG